MNTLLYDLMRWLALGAVALVIFGVGLGVYGAWYDEWSGFNSLGRVSDGSCNIAIIPVHGEMSTTALYDEYGTEIPGATLDDFIYNLRSAEYDSNIDGVLVSVDSWGGSPYAGEAIANELLRSPLTSAAVIRDMGVSAGYWAATGADQIFASAVSTVGSIGATMSYLEYAQQNEDSGLRYVEIASGPLKDAGNPDRFLSEEERARLQEEIDLLADVFVKAVATNRGLSEEKVRELADGGSLPGPIALSEGLIDELGDRESAREWFAKTLEIPLGEVVLCE